jgi:hypothetical protein
MECNKFPAQEVEHAGIACSDMGLAIHGGEQPAVFFHGSIADMDGIETAVADAQGLEEAIQGGSISMLEIVAGIVQQAPEIEKMVQLEFGNGQGAAQQIIEKGGAAPVQPHDENWPLIHGGQHRGQGMILVRVRKMGVEWQAHGAIMP